MATTQLSGVKSPFSLRLASSVCRGTVLSLVYLLVLSDAYFLDEPTSIAF